MDASSDRGEEAFDPQAPLIGRDGLEYESFADLLAGRPFDSFRNDQIARLRQGGASEKDISLWIFAYDCNVPLHGELELCADRGAGERAARALNANRAIGPRFGLGNRAQRAARGSST